jgi:hypothetical protein
MFFWYISIIIICKTLIADHQLLWGKSNTLRVEPRALAGRFVENLDNTAPELPWLRLMRPHIVWLNIKYSKSIFGFSGVGFVDVCYSLAKIILSRSSVIDSFKSKDSLVDILSDFRSELTDIYLLKLRNLALTQSLTFLSDWGLAIFLFLGAFSSSGIWLILIINNIKTIIIKWWSKIKYCLTLFFGWSNT